MKFIKLVWEAAGKRRLKLVLSFMASTFGLLGVLVVISFVLDPQTGPQDDRTPDIFGLLLFALVAFGVIGGNAMGQRLSAQIVEDLLDRIRRDFADLVRRSDYGRFESFGPNHVYDTLTRNSQMLTEGALMAIHGISALGGLVLAGFYTLLISPLVFGVIASLIVLTTFFYRLTQRKTHDALTDASAKQGTFYTQFRHLIEGFKEVKLHHPRGDSLEHDYLEKQSARVREAQVDAAVQINRGISVSYLFFYTTLATIAFVLPPFVGDQAVIVQSVYVAVFMLSVVEVILKAVPVMTRANFAIDELQAVEAQLRGALRKEAPPMDGTAFGRIDIEDLRYSYFDPDGARSFTMGPTSLYIDNGEVLFLIGGNGSGKSTLVKAMTCLYEPESGRILRDRIEINEDNVADYRALFSGVFSDFHLFDRLYGLEHVSEGDVNALLEDLGIAHKTRYLDGAFTNTNLSTGQRKRLALAVALLEKRPILVLDELAADQDPEFRQRFYNELIPRWKSEGRTLVIVSHEDQYFHVADRTLVLVDGKAQERDADGEGTR